jgi:hypothetical protein
MSGAVLTIGGGVFSESGVVAVPLWVPGGTTAPGSLGNILETYLDNIAASIAAGQMSIVNDDVATNTLYSYYPPASGGYFGEFTNTDSTGSASSNTVNGSYTVAPGITDLTVQAPGNLTIAGVGTTSVALFGAYSNVDYSVTDPVPGFIYAGGGADSITLYSTATQNAESIYSAGTDTINLFGYGNDYVTVGPSANDVIQIEGANAHVTATGAATVALYWDNANAGGTLDFVNNSSTAATIYTSTFANGQTAPTHVTAYGGAGGGFFVGGQAGYNSLVGGSGVVTLMGGGSGDYLYADSNEGQNELFGGSGDETLVASANTVDNMFQVGLQYAGLATGPAANGVISTAGSGVQTFFLGNSDGETIYGSQNAQVNSYNIISDDTAGGGIYNIYNFGSNSFIQLINGTDTGAGDASISAIQADPTYSSSTDIFLSDGTLVRLHGVSVNDLATTTGSNGATIIY